MQQTKSFSSRMQSGEVNPVNRSDGAGALSVGLVAPDGSCAVYAMNHNLMLVDRDGSDVRQLTEDGVSGWSYALPRPYYAPDGDRDQLASRPSAEWSPDGRFLMIWREDVRHLADMWIMDSVSDGRPMLRTYKARLPGEPAKDTSERLSKK